ncbi:MAG: class II fructose-bisphosphatase [Anaerolineae bacterium]|nr:class II fructose-bisphosphatase [Anaerolineae bacterium]MCO5196477.1 class II fructose-bisphosphatase [Anaerolineae bacterium]MCO5207244.1 class II fructose-bisphosphatase [Anaerolineae bacterium]
MNELQRNLGLDLVRVTEAAALAGGRWMGKGDPDTPEEDATNAMLEALDNLNMDGEIAVAETWAGEHALPLVAKTRVGNGKGPAVDVVVDPIDGRKLLAAGQHGAISVAAVAPRGTLWSPHPAKYMEKLVVDRDVAQALVPECLDAPAAWTLALIARMKKVPVDRIVVFVLDRPRHQALIDEIRATGARVVLRSEGDIAGALKAATVGTMVDAMMGVGGAAEGVISACAVRALGGAMLARPAARDEADRVALAAAGVDLKRILSVDDIVQSEEVFFAATGVTDGSLLRGIQFDGDRANTESMVLRGHTRTRRLIYSEHVLEYRQIERNETAL